MERKIDRKDCVLYGTRYCDQLHMAACGHCPLTSAPSDNPPEQIRARIDTYESLLPEGGIAHLFESKTCRFCRNEAAAKPKKGYAIISMAHPEPATMKQGLLFGKRRAAVGTMVPLQPGICKDCRRRLLALEYLPVVLPVLVGGTLLALLVGRTGEALAAVAGILPFAVWLIGLLLAWGGAKLLVRLLAKRFRKVMYVNFLSHPTVRAMTEKGWFPVPPKGAQKPVFSKTRIARGLGTAPSDGTARQRS